MIEDKMSNKSVIAITIHTDFKPQIDEKGLFIWGTFNKTKGEIRNERILS